MTASLPPRMVPAALPETLAVFPLPGAVLLPGARLPLNIFEPRYLAMIEDALGHGRLLGMIQPASEEGEQPPLYSVGCAGRITSFNETDDGRFLIVLTGLCRFRVAQELPATGLYRSVRPDWKPYLTDLGEQETPEFDRDHLIDLLQVYFKKNGIVVDWKVVQGAPSEILLPTIIMISPLAPAEKQALLEAESVALRARMLTTLLEMAVMPQQSDSEAESKH